MYTRTPDSLGQFEKVGPDQVLSANQKAHGNKEQKGTSLVASPYLLRHALLTLQADLVGKSLLDVIQARDVPTLREQLTPAQSIKSPHSPRCLYNLYESDAESTRIFVSNCRRAFFCRFRNHLLEEDATGDKTFGPLHKKSRSKPYQPGNEDLNDYSISMSLICVFNCFSSLFIISVR